MRFPTGSRARRWALYAAGLVGLGAAVDATLIEPNWIEVVRSVEYLAMLPTVAPDLTLMHLRGSHIGSIGYRERRAIDIINDAQPDIIILSGDLVRGGDRPRGLQTVLGSLRARYGKFLVWGNHDYRDGVPGTWGPEVVEHAGFTLLRNSSRAVIYRGGKIVIAGLDDPITGHDNLRLAMTRVSRRDPCILVSHTPEVARSLGHGDIDRLLAGRRPRRWDGRGGAPARGLARSGGRRAPRRTSGIFSTARTSQSY